MGTGDIGRQFDACIDGVLRDEYYFIVPGLVKFGMWMVNDVIPQQAEYRNLTGNTVTSYAFGVYYLGKLEVMGFNRAFKEPLREKLVIGEVVSDFVDYDGKLREEFFGMVDTDAGYGENTSMRFLQSYVCNARYGIVFTTGTEYSEYLENVMYLNVLTDAYETSKGVFLKSFKPIE